MNDSIFIPNVNSAWIEENFLGGAWVPRGYSVVWRVHKVFNDSEGLKVTMTNGHIDCDVPVSAFSDDGAFGTDSFPYRMRPRP